ncbi:hypothetical protein [Mycetocola saprophilus]|uniref:hypothetical protein n=1 Tax=Mycetocola saprophilus TaxID=76636 RepID=UPI0012DF7A32|nr:hypothetical protein [Mycetocola saprophilus]
MAIAERERRSQASEITAWSISRHADDRKQRRGLYISNGSNSAVFDVEISSTYSESSQANPTDLSPLNLAVLPPGEYVVFGGEKYAWELPQERGSFTDSISPIMNNPGWKVTRIVLTDSHGTTWQRDHGLLKEAQSSPNAPAQAKS